MQLCTVSWNPNRSGSCVTNRINVRVLWGKRVPRYGRVDELFAREDGDKRLEKGMS